ncbi:S26 family signal peptidase [Bacteroides thetaiotaomicron]|nr:S26 family signal peptidase [Bacteroides thetaiotaomicron]
MANSQDSRYWGMLPEEYIVGKATWVWYSKERYTENVRWKRIMKRIG